VTYDDSEHTAAGWCKRDATTKKCLKDSTNFEYQKVDASSVMDGTNYITFDVKEDMIKPVHLYYQLDNFYQNHRRYVKSRDDKQLRGVDEWSKNNWKWDSSVQMNEANEAATPARSKSANAAFPLCTPLVLPNHVSGADCTWNTTTGSGVPCKVMWPCGLIAGSFFNDWYLPIDPVTGATTDSDWSEKNIAWVSDRQTKFKLPTKASANWDYKDDVAKGVSSDYYHLYQMYPSFPNLKEEGLTNEHFIVWMRTAGLPTFRKLYARINKDLKKGEQYTIAVNPGFNVTSFKGKKRLVLSTTSWMGGKNSFLGIAYVVVGSISLVLGLGFLIMDKLKPRKLGDTNYLVWS